VNSRAGPERRRRRCASTKTRACCPSPIARQADTATTPGATVERVGFIRSAQQAGLTLRQIGEILDIRDGGRPPCEHVGILIDQRLAEVEQRIAELEQTRDRLRELARRTGDVDPAECSGYCDIIRPEAAAGAGSGERP
jgi:hypothetical protein